MDRAHVLGLLPLAAAVLAIERIAYVLIWHHPARFRRLAARCCSMRDPIAAMQALFLVFKLLQIGVFAAWIHLHGGWSLRSIDADSLEFIVGITCIVGGQAMNLAVFARLGLGGVFYGNRFGRGVHQSNEFPFSVLRHPQYVGTVASIWGLFLITRFPHPDWFVLPALETAYYGVGARLER